MESSEQKYKKIGRNKVCFCGSGIKFKKCCLYKYHILDKDKIGIETANLNAVEYKITYDALPSPDLDQFKREDRDLFTKIFDNTPFPLPPLPHNKYNDSYLFVNRDNDVIFNQ